MHEGVAEDLNERGCRGFARGRTDRRRIDRRRARLGTTINRDSFVTGVICKKNNRLLVLLLFDNQLTGCD